MYVPRSATVEEVPEVLRFVRAHSFGILVSGGPRPLATHVPLDLVEDGERRTLIGHVARANRHWRDLGSNPEVLAIFSGPHAYVSPRWFESPDVPTWNYTAAHLYGRLRLVTERQELLQLVEQQVALREDAAGYSVHRLPPDVLGANLRGIVGFTIEVERVEASFKLGRAWDPVTYANVVRELEAGTADDQALAAWMRSRSPDELSAAEKE